MKTVTDTGTLPSPCNGELYSELKQLGVNVANESVISILDRSFPQLKEYQRAGVLKCLKLNLKCCLFDEMGLGKSVQALLAVCIRYTSKVVHRKTEEGSTYWPKILVICPGLLRSNWCNEIEKWAVSFDIDDIQVLMCNKDIISNRSKVVVCGYAYTVANIPEVLRQEIFAVIVDESHKTRTFSSKRTRAVTEICRNFSKHNIFLSGTPMLINPSEMFAQLNIVLGRQDKLVLNNCWPLDVFDTKYFNNFLRFNLTATALLVRFFSGGFQSKIQQNISVSQLYEDPTKALKIYVSLSNFSHFLLVTLKTLNYEITNNVLMKRLEAIVISYSCHLVSETLCLPKIAAFRLQIQSFWKAFKLDLEKPPTLEKQRLLIDLNNMLATHEFLSKYCKARIKSLPYLRSSKGSIIAKAYSYRYEYVGVDNSRQGFLKMVVQKYVIRRTKSEVLTDLPPKIRNVVLLDVRSNNDLSSLYQRNEIRDHEYFPTKSTENSKILCKTTRENSRYLLHSVSEAADIPSSGLPWELMKVGLAKSDATAEYLIELLSRSAIETKFAAFALHLQVIEKLRYRLQDIRGTDPSREAFGRYSFDVITGKMRTTDRARVIDQFQSQPEPRLLILSLLGNSVGFNLCRASMVIMCEQYWSPSLLNQAEDRVHRIGQKDNVFVKYLVARNTLDETLWSILQKRIDNIASFLPEAKDSTQDIAKIRSVKRLKAEVGASLKHFKIPKNRLSWGFRVNNVSNRVYIYYKGSEAWVWTQRSFPIDFLITTSLPNEENGYEAPLLSFAFEWINCSSLNKNKLLGLLRPLQLPLQKEIEVAGSSSFGANSYSQLCKDLNKFNRFTSSELQVHRSASVVHGCNEYIIKKVIVEGLPLPISQAWLINANDPLCIFCAQRVTEDAPTVLQDLFCSPEHSPCYSYWLMKCCKTRARNRLREIDHGVCRICNVDTLRLKSICENFPPQNVNRQNVLRCTETGGGCPHEHVTRWNSKAKLHWTTKQLDILGEKSLTRIIVSKNLTEGLFWEADHKVAVKLGGSGIEDNYQTLCVPCHREKTKTDRYKMFIRDLKRRQKMVSIVLPKVEIVDLP